MPEGALDRGAFVWVVEHRVGWLDPVFVGLSATGYAGALWVALAAAIVFFGRRPFAFPLLLTVTAVWTADLFALALKGAVDRPRPTVTVPEADPLMGAGGHSLPSGHAATAFAGALVLTFLWRRGAPLFFVLAAAMAFSRVYVGVHYPGDVLAGAALGALVGAAFIAAFRLPRRSGAAPRRSEGEPPAG